MEHEGRKSEVAKAGCGEVLVGDANWGNEANGKGGEGSHP